MSGDLALDPPVIEPDLALVESPVPAPGWREALSRSALRLLGRPGAGGSGSAREQGERYSSLHRLMQRWSHQYCLFTLQVPVLPGELWLPLSVPREVWEQLSHPRSGKSPVSVPVTVVMHRHRLPGSATAHPSPSPRAPSRCLLSCYGAYGMANPIDFRADFHLLLSRGFVLCYGHVRGGGELGTQWYREGTRLRKWNSILDTLAVAKHLVDRGKVLQVPVLLPYQCV